MSIIDRTKALARLRAQHPAYVFSDSTVDDPATRQREFFDIDNPNSARLAITRLRAAAAALKPQSALGTPLPTKLGG